VSDAVRIAELTERENEIAVLLLKGWPYKLIAAALFISESTVKTHVQSIYLKLNIHSRTELIQKISLNG
jgi:DNA-binding NarL/FixJ family response regulator